MASDQDIFQGMEEIRHLLLKPEVLIDRITPVIAEILAEHIASARDEMAEAIAPILGEAIRRQVYQAREDIVDALYPVVGQTINKAITEALRDLAREIDVRVHQNILQQNPMQRWHARLKGIPEEAYTLRAVIPFTIQEIFLIQRDTGILICHTSHGTALADRDLISGMLTAIRDFAREVLGHGQSGELGTIMYESRQILLEAGGTAYLAIVIDGVEPGNFREQMRQTLVKLHERYYTRLKQFDGNDTALVEKLQHLLEGFFSPTSPPQPTASQPLSRIQRFILVFVLLLVVCPPLLLCGGWIWHVERRMAALAAVPATALPVPTATTTPSPTATPPPPPTTTPTDTPTPPPTATPTPLLGVMIGNVFLRADPQLEDTRTALVAPEGAQVEVLAQYGDWYRVRVAITTAYAVELVGWVPTQWVGLVDPVPPELVTPTAVP